MKQLKYLLHESSDVSAYSCSTDLHQIQRILAFVNIQCPVVDQFLRWLHVFVEQGQNLLFTIAELRQFNVR